jgi:hypothetical protein
MSKIEEKAPKAYVDYHLSNCLQKEVLDEVKDQIKLCATTLDLKNFDIGVGEHLK